MSQQFILTFGSENEAEAALAKIDTLRLDDGQQVMWGKVDGIKVLTGCAVETPPAENAMVSSGASSEKHRFFDMFYPLDALRSGMHHPDGVLWVRTPSRRHVAMDRKVSLLEVAPTLVALAGVDTPHQFQREPISEVLDALKPLRAVA